MFLGINDRFLMLSYYLQPSLESMGTKVNAIVFLLFISLLYNILKLNVVRASLMMLVVNCLTPDQCALVEVLENTLCVGGRLECMSSPTR